MCLPHGVRQFASELYNGPEASIPGVVQLSLLLERIWQEIVGKCFTQPFIQPLSAAMNEEQRRDARLAIERPSDLSMIESKIRHFKYLSGDDFRDDCLRIESNCDAFTGYMHWDRKYQALNEAAHSVTLLCNQLLRRDQTEIQRLELRIAKRLGNGYPGESDEPGGDRADSLLRELLPSWHPRVLRPHTTFQILAPCTSAFMHSGAAAVVPTYSSSSGRGRRSRDSGNSSSSTAEGVGMESALALPDLYYPEDFPRSPKRPDPNGSLSLVHQGQIHQPGKVQPYAWQFPSWSLPKWGKFLIEYRMGPPGAPLALTLPPVLYTGNEFRRDEDARIASILSTLQIPRDAIAGGRVRTAAGPLPDNFNGERSRKRRKPG